MTYMLDTNICIYVIKRKPENVLAAMKTNLNKGICISAITLSELEFGVKASKWPEKNGVALLQFLSVLDVLTFDSRAALQYGDICADLKRKGTPIGTMDTLIAAHARAENLVLVTNNTREFSRVENLKTENWV